jgi:integrase
MAQSKREQYERTREQIRELADAHETATAGDVPENKDWPYIYPADAEEMLQWCDGYDPEKAIATPTDADHENNRWGETRAPSTLRQWLRSVMDFARDMDKPLSEASADDFNQSAQRMYNGTAATVTKPLSKNTIRARQNCLIKYIRHLDNGVDEDDIAVFDMKSTVVDPEDMLTREEFHAIRNAPEKPRDKAIVDLFLYTGQRNYALRTLRIKDIHLEDKKYRLNPEADGLKGAELVGTWNPLLGAVGSVRDWLQHHPASDDPDAYLLTQDRDASVRDPYEPISDDTVNRVLRKAAKIASEESPAIENKPTHAHAMRHNFVTMCKRDYDLDDDVIKRLIRHKPESDVMTTTYKHLSDEDFIQKAEEAFGFREEDDESPMTPETCDVCNEPLPPNAKACPNCGTVYTPDAKASQDVIEGKVREQKEEADSLEEYKDADKIAQAVDDDPKLAAQLMDKLGELADDE